MDDAGKTIAISVMFLSMTAIFVLRGPLGRALAERLAGRGPSATREAEGLQGEIEELKHRLGEVEERLDFAERLLAKQRDVERIGPGGA